MANKASDGVAIDHCSTLDNLYETVIGSPHQKGYGELGTTNELTTLLGDPGFGRYTYAYANRIAKDCLFVVAPAWNKAKCAIKTVLKCNTSFVQTPWLKIE